MNELRTQTFKTKIKLTPSKKSEIRDIKNAIASNDPQNLPDYNIDFLGSFNFKKTKVYYWKDVFLDECGIPFLEPRIHHPNFQKPIPKPISGKIEFKLTNFRLPRRTKMLFGFKDKLKKVRVCKKIKIGNRQRNAKCRLDFTGYMAYRIIDKKRKRFKGDVLSSKRHLASFIKLRKASSNCATLFSGGCATKYQIILRLRGHYLIPMITMSNSLAYFVTEQSDKIHTWINIGDCFGPNSMKFEDNFAIGVEKDIIDDNILAIPIAKKAFLSEIK
jgi:hypothetical protein